MATTIASLHLLFVLGIAYWTKSRFLTWIAGFVALVAAFAIGSKGYGLLDAVSALIGLAIGLSMIPHRTEKDTSTGARVAQTDQAATVSTAQSSPKLPHGYAPAQMVELTPQPRRRPLGRWLVGAAVLAFIGSWLVSG